MKRRTCSPSRFPERPDPGHRSGRPQGRGPAQSGDGRGGGDLYRSWRIRVRSVAFSPDGRLLASTCQDDSVSVWDIPARRMAQHYDSPGNKVDVRFFRRTTSFWPPAPTAARSNFGAWRRTSPGWFWSGTKGTRGASRSRRIRPCWRAGRTTRRSVLGTRGPGEIKQVLTGHGGPVVSLAFSRTAGSWPRVARTTP